MEEYKIAKRIKDGWRGDVSATPAAEGPHWGMGGARTDRDIPRQDPSSCSVGNFGLFSCLDHSYLVSLL